MENEVPSVNRVDEIREKLTGTVELFDSESGERLFDYVAADLEE